MRRAIMPLAVVWAVLAGLAPGTARAHGDLFRWGYPRAGFHGEADLIRALEFLRLVYVADDPSHLYARRAESLTVRASTALCQPVARSAALEAVNCIRLYRQTHALAYIELAAQKIHQALLAERSCHCAPHIHVGPAVAVPAPAVPVVPAPALRPVPWSGVGIWSSSGTSFWGVRIAF